jgi:hypothetical protein
MAYLNIYNALLVIFISYCGFSVWQVAKFWIPDECSAEDKVCFQPYYETQDTRYDFHIFEIVKRMLVRPTALINLAERQSSKLLFRYSLPKNSHPVWSKHNISLQSEFSDKFQVSCPFLFLRLFIVTSPRCLTSLAYARTAP